jgi:hypothetical protein
MSRVGKEHCLSANQIKTLPIHGDANPSQLDKSQKSIDILLGQVTSDDCYAARPGDETPAVQGNVYSIPDISPAEEVKSKPYVDKNANVKAFNAFRENWGKFAVTSGTISSKYFDTYKFILSVPPPKADVSANEFAQKISELAQIIKTWYVNAQYNGNLMSLSNDIDQTMPKYTVIEGMAPYIANEFQISETVTFILIVGVGLASVCFWKAFQKSK